MVTGREFRRIKAGLSGLFLVVGLLLTPGSSRAADLQADTVNAWDSYVHFAHDGMSKRLAPHATFLWIDEDPPRAARVRCGQIEIAPMSRHGLEPVPRGLIHHWIGASFIPDASLNQVVTVVTDYDRYKDFFDPEIVDSHSVQHSPEADDFSIRLVNKVLFVSAGVDTLCHVQSGRMGGHRFYSISDSTRVQEIRNYGEPNERELAPDQGDGFIWRLSSIARYEERDGGVYMEIEAIALTRDVPASLHFLVNPIMKRLSRNSLLLSLQQTRSAVFAAAEASNRANALVSSDKTGLPKSSQALGFH